jgi:mannitol/fructose-specific phosphotransferase system IIA component (Ntr-type)
MSYSHLFKEKNIIEDLKSVEKKALLEELIDTAVERGLCPKNKKKAVLDSMLEREKLGSTGLGHGIAIPHVKIDGFQGQTSLLARSKSGVDFGAVDGEPVYIFFILVSPLLDAAEHLSILQWISRMARHQDFVSFVKNAKDAKEMLGIINEFGD